jgi:hypothetical protein
MVRNGYGTKWQWYEMVMVRKGFSLWYEMAGTKWLWYEMTVIQTDYTKIRGDTEQSRLESTRVY